MGHVPLSTLGDHPENMSEKMKRCIESHLPSAMLGNRGQSRVDRSAADQEKNLRLDIMIDI